MKTSIIVLLGCIYSSLLFAEPATTTSAEAKDLPWYQIELIIFEAVEPDYSNEKWPVVVEDPAPAESVELSPPANPASTKLQAFQLLNPEELQLAGVVKKLEHNQANRVMLHVAWRQPLVENADAIPVHIHSGLNEDFLAAEARQQTPATVIEPVTLNNPPEESPLIENRDGGASRPGNFIDGTVALTLSRYLHLKAHLVYFNPEVDLARQIAEQDSASPVVERFLLKESRRVRRKELHYLDHPYFGVIAQVTRFEPEKQ